MYPVYSHEHEGARVRVTVNQIHPDYRRDLTGLSHVDYCGYVILQHGCYGVSLVTACVTLQHGLTN